MNESGYIPTRSTLILSRDIIAFHYVNAIGPAAMPARDMFATAFIDLSVALEDDEDIDDYCSRRITQKWGPKKLIDPAKEAG